MSYGLPCSRCLDSPCSCRSGPVARWWQCSNGHRNEITPDAPAIFRARCDQCLDGGDSLYRIERDVAEDDPTKVPTDG